MTDKPVSLVNYPAGKQVLSNVFAKKDTQEGYFAKLSGYFEKKKKKK